MFDLHWGIASGLDARLFGQGSPFTWQMRMIEALIVVGFGSTLALALRKRTSACVWIIPALTSFLRVLLDPVRYPYYWDTGLVLILLGTAHWAAAPRLLASRIERSLATWSARPAASTPYKP
jgi:hypothetical protein